MQCNEDNVYISGIKPLYFQHYLTAFGSTITVPLVLYESFCMDKDIVGLSELISTIFFVSGISTLIQTTIGVRYDPLKKQFIPHPTVMINRVFGYVLLPGYF